MSNRQRSAPPWRSESAERVQELRCSVCGPSSSSVRPHVVFAGDLPEVRLIVVFEVLSPLTRRPRSEEQTFRCGSTPCGARRPAGWEARSLDRLVEHGIVDTLRPGPRAGARTHDAVRRASPRTATRASSGPPRREVLEPALEAVPAITDEPVERSLDSSRLSRIRWYRDTITSRGSRMTLIAFGAGTPGSLGDGS